MPKALPWPARHFGARRRSAPRVGRPCKCGKSTRCLSTSRDAGRRSQAAALAHALAALAAAGQSRRRGSAAGACVPAHPCTTALMRLPFLAPSFPALGLRCTIPLQLSVILIRLTLCWRSNRSWDWNGSRRAHRLACGRAQYCPGESEVWCQAGFPRTSYQALDAVTGATLPLLGCSIAPQNPQPP